MAAPKELNTLSPQSTLLGNTVIIGVIVLTIAFFIGAGSGAYDPNHIFKMLFGFITLGTLALAVIAIVIFLIARIGVWLFRRS